MKSFITFVAMMMLFTCANAQNNKVQSAFNYRNNGQLDKAKEAIDLASVHEATMNKAKTWFYRGNIYLDIYLSKDDKYKKLDSAALESAYQAYQKAIELDVDKEYLEQIKAYLFICGEQFYNKGVDLYNQKKYEKSLLSFEKARSINAIFGVKDTLATYNAAVSAENAKMYDKAKDYYIKLIKLNYQQPAIYISLSNIYKEEKDTTKALATIKKAREAFPANNTILIAEINIYLAKGDKEKAQESLNLAMAKDSTNEQLYFAAGTLYDQMKNVEKAEKCYQKAIKLNPNYFDANFNLGALYFNEGVRIFEEADKITDMKKYNKEKEKYDALWVKAIPYFEKALTIDPKDQNTLFSLKQLYARTNQPEKLKKINDQLGGK